MLVGLCGSVIALLFAYSEWPSLRFGSIAVTLAVVSFRCARELRFDCHSPGLVRWWIS
jgi:hypothetical protein